RPAISRRRRKNKGPGHVHSHTPEAYVTDSVYPSRVDVHLNIKQGETNLSISLPNSRFPDFLALRPLVGPHEGWPSPPTTRGGRPLGSASCRYRPPPAPPQRSAAPPPDRQQPPDFLLARPQRLVDPAPAVDQLILRAEAGRMRASPRGLMKEHGR